MTTDCSIINGSDLVCSNFTSTAGKADWSWLQNIEVGAEVIIGVIVLWSLFYLWFGPTYRVWKQHKQGEADLAQAQNEQQIQVAEAKGRLAAAEANKAAAIVEAEAVSAQIGIIGDNVREHPLYLTWQWIEMMKHREGAVIYVPTEANLPVLEAGRLIGAGGKSASSAESDEEP